MADRNRLRSLRRILMEWRELQLATDVDFGVVRPLSLEDPFEWHFTLKGPDDSDFAGGLYHGRILLPPEYPLKPPTLYFATPNGRFETHKPICLNATSFHPESWAPSWGLRTMLSALQAFFPSPSEGAIHALDFSKAERQRLAQNSLGFRCAVCGFTNKEIITQGQNAPAPAPGPSTIAPSLLDTLASVLEPELQGASASAFKPRSDAGIEPEVQSEQSEQSEQSAPHYVQATTPERAKGTGEKEESPLESTPKATLKATPEVMPPPTAPSHPAAAAAREAPTNRRATSQSSNIALVFFDCPEKWRFLLCVPIFILWLFFLLAIAFFDRIRRRTGHFTSLSSSARSSKATDALKLLLYVLLTLIAIKFILVCQDLYRQTLFYFDTSLVEEVYQTELQSTESKLSLLARTDDFPLASWLRHR